MPETHEEKMLKVKYHHPKKEDLFLEATAEQLITWLEKEIQYLTEKIPLFLFHDIRRSTWKAQKDCYQILLKSFEEMGW
jgi:hypothetical protein